MEIVTGNITLKHIFLDNGNWWNLFIQNQSLIRFSIIVNVLKLLVCRTSLLGYHFFICPNCNHSIKVPHSCKSRFCPSCGKKATDNWIKTSFNTLPRTTWQHITFTMPDLLWAFFWRNRHLFNSIPLISANIIKSLSIKQGFLPGLFLAIHTFGRDLKRNIHIHLSTTIGGLSLTCDKWIKDAYFYHDTLKKMWRYEIISLLRNEFKNNNLKLPSELKYIKSYDAFSSWTSQFYNTTWVVHLKKQSDNMRNNVEYLGKYLKRPPIGETRIKHYDGKNVTYEYLDHYHNTTELMTLPVLDFIGRLIAHIPDKNFRNIRYYGFLANRVRGKLLPIVYNLLEMKNVIKTKVYTPWRKMIQLTFKYDPLKCPHCKTIMKLDRVSYPSTNSLLHRHQEIANVLF